MDFPALRVLTAINRFGTLRRVEKAFAGVATGTILSRPLFGRRVWLDVSRSSAQRLLFAEGERFIDERKLVADLLAPGMSVVDVGANIGYYLLMFEQVIGPTGRVICIEPSVENLPELRANIENNGVMNAVVHAVALGDRDGETGLRTGINSGISDAGVAAYTVPLRRLDTLVQEKVDVMKIDVEGYEGQVLAGAEQILARDKPLLFLELHPHIVGRFGYSVGGILDSLRRHYRSIRIFEKPPAAEQSLLSKLLVRYFGASPVREVTDVGAYLQRYDRGDIPHTFWAICRP